ncbi:D-2-hydroxyacid dehydrogenase [Sporolactobacillus spathodeae]|uniref:D-lactate dehydrogenase n=1 Tax=Sporolactobacillus spathodeae TaxID=1465502 RepID=A0ABS2QB60_9BACL|nr:D-2-hydroxyacid dehydrogenase [Sporolactobacillus spathodeae]MBM7658389.1 D-lactate dehydrogenase [Sporolactobacillus spathodeae]
MRLLAYHAFEDELPEIHKWSETNGIEVVVSPNLLTAATVDEAKGFDGISIQQTERISDPVVYQKLHEFGIRQISTRTAGFDVIDLVQAAKNHLIITNVPAYSPYAIAELAVAQTLQLTRHLPQFNKRFANQDFRWNGLISREIRSLTIGIIGTGRIGATAAELFRGLGARVIGFDVYPNPQLGNILEYQETIEDVLKEADVVSLHTPLMAATRHMIDKDNLKLMKKDAYLINVARGALVNTDDLIAALENGQIAGAALDAFESEWFNNQDLSGKPFNEPQITKLMAMDNVLLTPHIGFYTKTAVKNMVDVCLDSVVEILQTGTSVNRVDHH